jgi:hypothetical protein
MARIDTDRKVFFLGHRSFCRLIREVRAIREQAVLVPEFHMPGR